MARRVSRRTRGLASRQQEEQQQREWLKSEDAAVDDDDGNDGKVVVVVEKSSWSTLTSGGTRDVRLFPTSELLRRAFALSLLSKRIAFLRLLQVRERCASQPNRAGGGGGGGYGGAGDW
jgi:hypothetical protein